MKICRGSGVVVKVNSEWKIKQYVLSMTVPNENTDSVVKIKLQEVSSQMKSMSIDNNIKDRYVISLMRTYDLIQEVKNVIK